MTASPILLVEDDKRLANLVKQYLEAHQFTVVIESHGNRVMYQLDKIAPSLVILDIGLPGMNGLEVCRTIRPVYAGPILMLTARNADADQVLGFEYGADDYVTKQTPPAVLLARIKALLRRAQPISSPQQGHLDFGALQIDLSARTAFLNTIALNLSSHEFDVLVELAKEAGNIVSREYLFDRIYGREYDGVDRTVDVRISHLRKKVSENGRFPDRIKTVWGKGYLFDPNGW